MYIVVIYASDFRSRFTRAQRVTVCMAMMYLFFVVSAVFFGTSNERLTVPFTAIGFIRFDIADVCRNFVETAR